MPNLTVDGVGSFQVPAGKRLVLALTEEPGADQLHACGGHARFATSSRGVRRRRARKDDRRREGTLSARGLTDTRICAELPDRSAITIWKSEVSAVWPAAAEPTPANRPTERSSPPPVMDHE